MNAFTPISRSTPIIHVEGNRVFATSKDVAEFFGKRHDHVLEAITDILKMDISIAPNFRAIELPVKVGFGIRRDRAFEMDRDGFTLLAMGFTGPKALKFKLAYIAAFNEAIKRLEALEAAPTVPALPDFTNPARAAIAWAEQYERAEKERLAAQAETVLRIAAVEAEEKAERQVMASSKASCALGCCDRAPVVSS
ncbi:Rha family transcriptional regulator [Oryzibacter oryziterrae]|uniref:Rha family transcriptional regulator n=1 Tax=Oryzibacter oryziterrae TaxID=2766474 RepID=UPI001F2D557C|nr:Rha family transcriptional regulator [Oryzibacter oryziterrae]